MTGTTQGGKKAAETRGHESLSAAGKRGGQQADHRHSTQSRGHKSLSQTDKKGGSRSKKDYSE
ncbi:hypothetical protein ACNVED_13370 [Legionella sp. D16C41]|uniref:hypothetical protein n=1 Tax=Legionella sp. D16C41 TaxID=3402688 RepID=UPI003AF9DD44